MSTYLDNLSSLLENYIVKKQQIVFSKDIPDKQEQLNKLNILIKYYENKIAWIKKQQTLKTNTNQTNYPNLDTTDHPEPINLFSKKTTIFPFNNKK
jgi:hypothetical protein